jgi:DNA-binding PadR family transcriptional regulator
MSAKKTDIPYGTLDLLVLKTLDTMGPMHGFGLARRIEQVAENLVRLKQGSVCPALLRLQQRRLIALKWGFRKPAGRRNSIHSQQKERRNSTLKPRTGSNGQPFAGRSILIKQRELTAIAHQIPAYHE